MSVGRRVEITTAVRLLLLLLRLSPTSLKKLSIENKQANKLMKAFNVTCA